MHNTRIESDFLGEMEIPAQALFGIHAARARQNFPDTSPFNIHWYKAMGLVKRACYNTYRRFKTATLSQLQQVPAHLRFADDNIIDALCLAADEVAQGFHFEHFIVPAMQGGAGTSINMNVNEIITNTALLKLGSFAGNYALVDTIEHANVYQSTNDVVPTALRVAAMQLLQQLETSINELRFAIEQTEKQHRDTPRVAYTQMQEAVPSSYGKLFSAYADALSRDWWRVSKCLERIKVVNLGGSAVGTSLAVPRFFVMEVVNELQQLTRLPVTRCENLTDATQNNDVFVEVHAMLKAHAVNLEKISSDLRLLASDVVQNHEISIPQRQVGSSIMPGKVNPVIVEFVVGVAHKVYSNDVLISSLAGQGCLDLNAYLPQIGDALLNSLQLLASANQTLQHNLIQGLQINSHVATDRLYRSASITTALSPYIGYHKAAELAKLMKKENLNIFEANQQLLVIDDEMLKNLLQPSRLLQAGFSVRDIV